MHERYSTLYGKAIKLLVFEYWLVYRAQCYYGDNPRGEFNDGKKVMERIEAGGFDVRAYQVWFQNKDFKEGEDKW